MSGLRKVCTNPNCKKEKNLEEFGLNKGKSDGHESWCKVCVSKKKEIYYTQKKKKEKLRIKSEQECQSTIIGNVTEEIVVNFCQIFNEIYRGLSYANTI